MTSVGLRPGKATLMQRSRRLVVGVASQFLNMSSNALMVLALARSTSSDQFGRYSLVYGASVLAVGVTRASTADLVAARAGGDRRQVHAQLAGALGRAALVASCLAVVVTVVGQAIGAGVVGLLLAASVLPIGLYEYARQGFFASYQPGRAMLIDLLWIAGALGSWLILRSFATFDKPTTLVVAWVLGAVLAAAHGLATVMRFDRAPGDATQSRRTMFQYGLEFLLSRGAPEVVAWSLALFGSVAQAGHFRLAQVLLGPLSVVIGGSRALLISELRPAKADPSHLLRLATRSGLGIAILPAIFLAALVLVPDGLISAVLGDVDTPVLEFAALLAVRRSLGGLGIPPFLVLRILESESLTSLLRLLEAFVAVLCIAGAGYVYGAIGALIGYVLASALSCGGWWIAARRAVNSERVRLVDHGR